MTRSEPHVLIAMGAAGVVTRVLPDRFGSSWTYVGKNVAPGQIDLGRLLEEFRFRVISGSPDVYGVLGSPLLHSLSPVMHNAGFGALAKDAIYLPLEARDIDDFTTFADAFGIRGVSVTTPFKEAMVMRVSTIDELGERIGAINTVRIEEDGWSGINTDVPGFLEPLDGRLELDCSRAVVLGSGGAAAASSWPWLAAALVLRSAHGIQTRLREWQGWLTVTSSCCLPLAALGICSSTQHRSGRIQISMRLQCRPAPSTAALSMTLSTIRR